MRSEKCLPTMLEAAMIRLRKIHTPAFTKSRAVKPKQQINEEEKKAQSIEQVKLIS
jgi:hypothetical protein